MLFNVKKQVFNFTLLLIIISSALYSQKTLSLDSLWSGKYDADRLESIRSMKDGESYTILKKLKEANTTQIIQYYYQNPKQWNVIVDSDDYIDIESFSDYTFSKNEKKLLLESNVIPVYRRSKVADYWVFDLTTKELQKVSDNKIKKWKEAFNQELDIFIIPGNHVGLRAPKISNEIANKLFKKKVVNLN